MSIQEYYFGGYYSKILSEYSGDKSNDGQFIQLRSRLALGQIDFVLQQTKDTSASVVYSGLNLLANVTKLDADKREEYIANTLDQQLNTTNQYYNACLAVSYLLANKPESALETIADSRFFEAPLIKVQCYLAFDRLDLAEGCINETENESLRYILRAVIAIRKDPASIPKDDKNTVQNALPALLDLQERLGMSALLSALIASCHFVLGETETAQSVISSSQQYFINDPTYAINQAVANFPKSDLKSIKNDINMITTTKTEYSQKINELMNEFDVAAEEINK